jgi:hypothetical protein
MSNVNELKSELEFLIYNTTDMEAIERKTQELQEAREDAEVLEEGRVEHMVHMEEEDREGYEDR